MGHWKDIYLYGGKGQTKSKGGLRQRKNTARGSPIMANGDVMKTVLGDGSPAQY